MAEMADPPINLNFNDLDDEEGQTYHRDEVYKLKNFVKDIPSAVSFRRPMPGNNLWAFWCEPTLSPCSTKDSVTHTPTTKIKTNQGFITEKIKYVLLHYSDNTFKTEPVLIQFWAPITTEKGCFLVTSGQPFAINKDLDEGFLRYRKHCLEYKFNVDGEEEEHLGILGLVFCQKWRHCTPNVRYYSSKEYPQRNFALTCDISASFAFPVFHTSFQDCVGVLEVVTNTHFRPLDTMCNSFLKDAFKDVDLKAFLCQNNLRNEIGYDPYGDTQDEISQGLKVVCRTHKLPLAQTWVPCRPCDVVAYGGSMENSSDMLDVCMGQVFHLESKASYVREYNNHLEDFLDFCSLNGLLKGQGVVRRAYMSRKPCFCRDITQFSITEYPLVPGARHFGLISCVAICLQSTYTGIHDYILEFFLHPEIAYGENPSTFLCSLLETMKQHFPSFKLTSGEQLGKDLSIEIIKPRINQEPTSSQCQSPRSPPRVLHNGQEMRQPYSDKLNSINYEELEKHFGKKLEDVAQLFGVSRSTFKRICRQNGICRWQRCKRNKVNNSPSRQNPPCFDLPKRFVATDARMTALVTTTPEVRTMTIKATYGDDMIKFQLHFSSRMVELEEEVSKRLKLNIGTYKIKYTDDDADQVLIACDEDLQDCMSASNSLGVNTIKMFIEPITKISPST